MTDADIPTPDRSNATEAPDDELDIEQFVACDDEQELSLDELSQAYAETIGSVEQLSDSEDTELESSATDSDETEEEIEASDSEDVDDYPVTPRNILEAILFVGHPQDEPLTSKQLASLMRGVRPDEINAMVQELNDAYEDEGCPYAIVSEGAGYKMRLRQEYASLRDKFYGRVREAKLSQSAVDVLSVVAYQQGTTKKDVDSQRGKPSGALLNQLVRRQLLRIEREEGKKRTPRYYTTDRFLHLFGLDSVEELPRSQDLEKNI